MIVAVDVLVAGYAAGGVLGLSIVASAWMLRRGVRVRLDVRMRHELDDDDTSSTA